MKTEKQIERDFYTMLKQSEVGTAIRGKLYRYGHRPPESREEDIVVKFISGIDAQEQIGVVSVDTYVPDVHLRDGRSVSDDERIAELEELLLKFVEENENTEYLLESESTPVTVFNEDIQQHFIYYRIHFNRINA